jgi:hypothetical protein
MSESVKDYYLRLHNARGIISDLGRFYKGMKSTNEDVLSDTVLKTDNTRKQHIGMKQTLLDTTTGGYFLRDLLSGDAFSDGLPDDPEDYFQILFENISRLTPAYQITQDSDKGAYKPAPPAFNAPAASVKNVVTPMLTDVDDAQSRDLSASKEAIEKEGGVVYKKDADGSPIMGLIGGFPGALSPIIHLNGSPEDIPDRYLNPTLGAIVFKNSTQQGKKTTGISIANRNSDLMNLFFNAIPPIEMSRCVPFINMYVMTPKAVSASEFNNVMFMKFIKSGKKGTFELDDNIGMSRSAPTGLGYFGDQVIDKNIAGMDLFTSPQMMSNADIRKVSVASGDFTMSGADVLEPIAPFLTLESLSTNISSAGQALLQSKTASMKLVLHDRSRLKDISPLISPEQFGMTKIFLEYGWSHPDGDITSDNDFGRLLNSLRDVGLYTVQSSNFNLGSNSAVSIDVTLACLGGSNETKNISTACGNATPIDILKPFIDKAAQKFIDEEVNGGREKTLPEVRKVLKVKQQGVRSGQSMVNREYFMDLANASGLTTGEMADNKTLLEIFKAFLTESDPTSVLKQDGMESSLALSKEDVVSKIYGKAYGCTTTGFTDSVSAELTRTPDPFLGMAPPPVNEKTDIFVSFGKLMMSFVGASMAMSSRCDEVQMLFYPLNNQSGKARVLTTANFPVYKEDFLEMLRQETRDRARTNISTTRFFKMLEKTFVEDPKNPVYGINTVLDEIEKKNKELKEQNKEYMEARVELDKEYADRNKTEGSGDNPDARTKAADLLHKAYTKKLAQLKKENTAAQKTVSKDNKDSLETKLGNIYAADGLDEGVEAKFVKPNFSMYIETVPALAPVSKVNLEDVISGNAQSLFKHLESAQGSKHICRIHIYDERASANSKAKFYQQLIENSGVITVVGGPPEVEEESVLNSEAAGLEDLTKIFDNKIMNKMEPIKKQRESTVVNDDESKQSTRSFYTIDKSLTTRDMKNMIKDYFPNVTLGANNSVVKSISVSSSTSGDVNNVLLLNSLANRKGAQPGGTDLVDQEEVKVIPSTIQLQCLGLPVVQRGNQIYIDMMTGTTLDNIYAVQSVSHSIKAGEFSTSLTLTATNQGDTDALKSKIRQAVEIKNESLISIL